MLFTLGGSMFNFIGMTEPPFLCAKSEAASADSDRARIPEGVRFAAASSL
jgi:hypothetical protein